ncbi:MAG: DUF4340 domain-containing protein [Vicinamibacterales bacterium]|jgi:hypothetical protein|nr:hypothetical protein [Acidobacteriota bacterium]MDP6373779.1 DUF4340 domain-containing protein [Vicinamibacterales bacterium]MDP6608221.1 DUF4340 domain-containing protein [Vicinamibacterales bacterium]HAK55183.1 hypothetical protein [Acidobacteriota bacterium]|tara:strand:- start:233 stop:1612 length:1380 start_codon:yes stop_codon:yes gene_type:complete
MTTSEIQKTMTLAGGAVALALLALVTAPRPATPDAFVDRGEPFFPEFTDPNTARTLEVVGFDAETGSARSFQVTNRDGLWTIPSHHDYPADGADRLARTAAGVIGITRDDFRSDNVADHEALQVLDPLDEAETSLGGRGTRVTLRGANDVALADFIIGGELEDRPGFRFVRLPDQKRVYAVRMDVDLSTSFADWIEPDLLLLEQADIGRLQLYDYAIDERTLSINDRDTVTLEKTDGTWTGDSRMPADREVDSTKVTELLTAVDGLSIVGVRPKPEGLSANLQRVEEGGITRADLASLQSRGYYLTREGDLRSNEGELRVRTTDGILYTLRFGEVLYGTGEAVTAGGPADASAEDAGPGENRYLFITAEFERDRFPEPPAPENMEFEGKAEADLTDADRANKDRYEIHTEWAEQVAAGEARLVELETRFAPWYYVISSESFEKVRLTRADVTKEREDPS